MLRIEAATILAGGFSLVAGCVVDLDVPDGALVSCSSDASACPAGSNCDIDIGYCVPSDKNDLDPPELVGAPALGPSPVGAGQTVEVTFTVDEPLIVAPTVVSTSGATSVEWFFVDSESLTYTFRYVTDGSEPEGSAAVSARLTDLSGNVEEAASLGTILLDFSPPVVTGVTVTNGVAVAGTTWLDVGEATLVSTVSDAVSGADLTLSVDGDVLVPGNVALTDPLTLLLTAGDGDKTVGLIFADAVGNAAAPVVLSLSVETTEPTNAIVVDEPVGSPYAVNADLVRVVFHSDGVVPADFRSYVMSTDSGTSWTDVTIPGQVVVDPLAQDTTTTVLIREEDLFGNQTAATFEGTVVLREDSQSPSKPLVATDDLIGNYGSGLGLYLAGPSADPGGEPVRYEAVGGANSVFRAVGAAPWFYLPGLSQNEATGFIIHAVDEAGNVSEPEFVRVVDSSVVRGSANACVPIGCFARYAYSARDGKATYLETRSSYTGLVLCTLEEATAIACGILILDNGPNGPNQLEQSDVFGRYVVTYGTPDALHAGLWIYDLGEDEVPQTADDIAQVQVVALGSDPALADNGMVYRNTADNTLWYYDFGEDRIYGTADTREGAVALPGSPVEIYGAGGRGASRLFDGRHFCWPESGSGDRAVGWHMNDFGPDRIPGTGDDVGEIRLTSSTERILLDSGRLYLDGRLVDLGLDGEFGTADDTERVISDVASMAGDKAVRFEGAFGILDSAPELLDLSSGESMALTSPEPVSVGVPSEVVVTKGFVFFALQRSNTSDLFPGFLDIRHPPGFVSSSVAGGRPGGTFAGEVGVFVNSPAPGQVTVRALASGNGWSPLAGWDMFDALGQYTGNVDVDGTRVVYLDVDGAIWIFDVGSDGIPGTPDDDGPEVVAAGPAVRKWPRLSGPFVVWADLGLDADGNWYGTDLDSRIRAVDLGADGWPGGGDDQTHDVTNGGKEIYPDVSGNTVVWLDLRTPEVDADGVCPSSGRGLDPNECTTDIYSTTIGSGTEQVIENNPAAQAAVQIEGDLVVWSDFRNGGDGAWDIFARRVGGATVQITDTQYRSETYPCIVGSRLGYFGEGPYVIEAGTDGLFGTPDDATLIEQSGDQTGSRVNPLLSERPNWLTSGFAVASDRLWPLADAAATFSSGAINLVIPDNDPAGVVHSIDIAAQDWQRVGDQRIRVTITHPAVRELTITLVSPTDDAAVLFDGSESSGGANLDATFDISTSPWLLNHYNEPVSGTWKLRVVDGSSAAAGGTLGSWTLVHQP